MNKRISDRALWGNYIAIAIVPSCDFESILSASGAVHGSRSSQVADAQIERAVHGRRSSLVADAQI